MDNFNTTLKLITENLNESKTVRVDKNLNKIVKHFLKFVHSKLEYDNMPEIVLDKDRKKVNKIRAMGYYMPQEHKIWIYVGNRNTADILRTLAHELVHAKQKETKGEEGLDGTTGSMDENEANAVAGIIMRQYGKLAPEIYN